jgi:hypothetical protein
MRVTGQLSPEEFWDRITAGEQRMRDSAAVLPVYRLADWAGPVLTGDWEWEDDALVTAGIAHGDPDGPGVHVRTTTHDPRAEVARLRRPVPAPAENLVAATPAAVEIWADGEILVDGTPVAVELWRDGERWWAAGAHDGRGLVLAGNRVPVQDVALVRVRDLEPFLAGRRDFLRALRGGI